MNIDSTTYGYQFAADLYCPRDVVEVLIEAGRAAPAARDLGAEETIEQVVAAEARTYPETHDSEVVPQRLGAYDGLDGSEVCGRCGEVLYQ